ncbi:MAG: amino acid transporter [Candidatus Nanopelagicales bacterium]
MLQTFEEAGCPTWVGGGWGVDALVGVQTRPHRDLDLMIDTNDLTKAQRALSRIGYSPATDWLPVRLELVKPGCGWVDLHPAVFDDDGNGVQAGLDGETLEYPACDLTTGSIAGVNVHCLSARLQVSFHSGYEPRAVDLHDLQQLRTVAH